MIQQQVTSPLTGLRWNVPSDRHDFKTDSQRTQQALAGLAALKADQALAQHLILFLKL
jgi:hypothetical protein